eukprot:CAMPEP_0115710972 /NCGR_PEP_ID=MMETSP0272-20121206/73313_1 /TAXON_ID=71861 /ORGANISM="Scrippsiella trochoidea, Strain CCMP3099" /LENGTH=61 /DNA_ID=CAMNT_0003152731 /DNA_START=29 /DNA_END=210 /DNA_ORIENTATION=-
MRRMQRHDPAWPVRSNLARLFTTSPDIFKRLSLNSHYCCRMIIIKLSSCLGQPQLDCLGTR